MAGSYGDIMKLSPTGASIVTAHGSRLSYSGVQASEVMVQRDQADIESLRPKIIQTANNLGLDPALIAAMASRESNAGKALVATGGWGDNRKAYGIMQCDVYTSGFGEQAKQMPWDSQKLMEFTLREILIPFYRNAAQEKTNWSKEQQLQGAVAAYNCGFSRVRTMSFNDIDNATTGNDYSNDVIARAQWLKRNANF